MELDMELKEFVQETLLAIHDAVKEAIDQLDAKGGPGTLNPHWIGDDSDWQKNVEKIEFDVAVTASDKTSGSGKAGIKVLSMIDIGADGGKLIEQSKVSKVKFSVPMILPASLRHAKTPA